MALPRGAGGEFDVDVADRGLGVAGGAVDGAAEDGDGVVAHGTKGKMRVYWEDTRYKWVIEAKYSGPMTPSLLVRWVKMEVMTRGSVSGNRRWTARRKEDKIQARAGPDGTGMGVSRYEVYG